VKPKMRRWTDPRDRTAWQVIYEPPTAEDRPSVRLEREGLVFRGDAGDFHAPAPYGWDLESLTEGDLQGLLDQARSAAQELHRTAGWGLPASEPAEDEGSA
jgi:hypothetical protein